MSIQIPREHLEKPELLTDRERWYLWTHNPVQYNRLGLEPPEPLVQASEAVPLPTRTTPLEEQTVPQISDAGGIVEDAELEEQTVPQISDAGGIVEDAELEEQTVPQISDAGGIVEDAEEDYEEGWNNNQRRAELARRELSVDGNKDELIARLRRSDADALLEDDYSKV